jgi:thiaminase/transcriptional activator TenA
MTYQFNDLKNAYPEEWQAYIEHRFVRQLGDGSLAPDAWKSISGKWA